MWPWLIILPLVIMSAGYVAWIVMPAPTRLRVARWLSRQASHGPAPLARLGERLEQAAQPTGGCGSCPASRIGQTPGSKARPPR